MIINIDTGESIATQIFDCLYAYFQSLDPDYKSQHSICFNRYSSTNDINILLLNMPTSNIKRSKSFMANEAILFMKEKLI
jgi:hypothetical protein